MRLTREILKLGKSKRGGYGAKQLRLLGFSWPPPQDWREQALEREIDYKSIAAFIELKDKHFTAKYHKRRELEQTRDAEIHRWMQERKTRSYEPPSVDVIAECPFELTEYYCQGLVRFGATGRGLTTKQDSGKIKMYYQYKERPHIGGLPRPGLLILAE